MTNKVCVYAICKDEAKEIRDWYENIKCADYVVVLDTGSTDGSVDILRELGVEVYVMKPETVFRFDDARNEALYYARLHNDCNIFFTTDFDERMSDGWYDYVVSHWDPKKHTRGVYDNYWEDQELPGSLNWMHDRDWEWKYPCHEVMCRRSDKSVGYSTDNELDMRNGIVVLRHHQDLTKTTREQYMDLLRLRYKENPIDTPSIAYYARECMYKNLVQEALDLEADIQNVDLSGNAGAWVCICLAWAHEKVGGSREIHHAEMLLYDAYRMDPGNRTAPVKLAELLHAEGNPQLAKAILTQAYVTAPKYSDRHLFLDNPDVWEWRMDDWMGVFLFDMGRFELAKKWFEKALEGAKGESRDHVMHNLTQTRKVLGETDE